MAPDRWSSSRFAGAQNPAYRPTRHQQASDQAKHLLDAPPSVARVCDSTPTTYPAFVSTFGFWPVVCCVAGSLRKGPIPVDRRSVAESHCDDDQLIVADLGNHSPVADPVSPVLA